MSDLIEIPVWVGGIYQLELDDPVEGGPEGIDNLQAKQLANRTAWLKQQVEQAGNDLDAHVAAEDPHPQYATELWVAAQIAALVSSAPGALDTLAELAAALGNDANFAATLTTSLASKVALSDKSSTAQAQAGLDDQTWMTPLKTKQAIAALSSVVGSATEAAAGVVELATTAETITGTDMVRATHAAGVKAAIQAAIAALVNSSPGTLDTLNELAAALGNDPNFATSMTNAIAAKLGLAGGEMTGRIGIQRYDSAGVSMGSGSGARTIDLTQANYFQCTAGGTTTFAFSGAASAGRAHGFVLELTNGGAYTITWPTSVKWPGGVAPTLTVSGVDVLVFVTDDGGVTWRGNLSIKDSK